METEKIELRRDRTGWIAGLLYGAFMAFCLALEFLIAWLIVSVIRAGL